MAYYLRRFIATDLPVLNPAADISPAPARDGTIVTIAGGYDSYGDGDAPPTMPYEISYSAATIAEDVTLWRVELDGLRALVRQSGRLYRRSQDTDEVQWCLARLTRLIERRQAGFPLWTNFVFTFRAYTLWNGAAHTGWALDSGVILDDGRYIDESEFSAILSSSPTNIAVTNGGNRVVTDAVITITAGGLSITAVTITKSGETKIAWTGVLASTKSLVIDCGAFTITSDGANAYSGKAAFDSNHTIAEWLRLDPGSNTVTITFAGGSTNSTAKIEFADGWA